MAVVAQALILLAGAKRGMATSVEIGEQLDLHPVVVRRLLGLMRSEGIVEARSGPNGGWAITRDPARITLGRIYRSLATDAPAATPTALDEVFMDAEDAYVARLDAVTLASLMA